jgi:hypothetical protein
MCCTGGVNQRILLVKIENHSLRRTSSVHLVSLSNPRMDSNDIPFVGRLCQRPVRCRMRPYERPKPI